MTKTKKTTLWAHNTRCQIIHFLFNIVINMGSLPVPFRSDSGKWAAVALQLLDILIIHVFPCSLSLYNAGKNYESRIKYIRRFRLRVDLRQNKWPWIICSLAECHSLVPRFIFIHLSKRNSSITCDILINRKCHFPCYYVIIFYRFSSQLGYTYSTNLTEICFDHCKKTASRLHYNFKNIQSDKIIQARWFVL